MDSVKLNADGVTPIQADLEKIASVKDKSEIVPLMAELAHSGVFPLFQFLCGCRYHGQQEQFVSIVSRGYQSG